MKTPESVPSFVTFTFCKAIHMTALDPVAVLVSVQYVRHLRFNRINFWRNTFIFLKVDLNILCRDITQINIKMKYLNNFLTDSLKITLPASFKNLLMLVSEIRKEHITKHKKCKGNTTPITS